MATAGPTVTRTLKTSGELTPGGFLLWRTDPHSQQIVIEACSNGGRLYERYALPAPLCPIPFSILTGWTSPARNHDEMKRGVVMKERYRRVWRVVCAGACSVLLLACQANGLSSTQVPAQSQGAAAPTPMPLHSIYRSPQASAKMLPRRRRLPSAMRPTFW